MQCPECRAVNPDFHRFCHACGALLDRQCTICKTRMSDTEDACPDCGSKHPAPYHQSSAYDIGSGERKYVTVMFCDLSGYTDMSEKLDPEDVKDIMTRIFTDIATIVAKYDGVIDKLIGDAAMILFGIPRTHEDDPVRAIRTALGIHSRIEQLSPEFEEKIGQALSMHTGINTGLVVTGRTDPEKGKLGITGDTVNVAARLEGLADPGEILVGPDTCLQAKGSFQFHPLPPTRASMLTKADPFTLN